MLPDCQETVSILYALIFGAGEACVSFGLWSILVAFGAFMVIVVILQFLARRWWAQITRQSPADSLPPQHPAVRADAPYDDDPAYRKSAIRSSRR